MAIMAEKNNKKIIERVDHVTALAARENEKVGRFIEHTRTVAGKTRSFVAVLRTEKNMVAAIVKYARMNKSSGSKILLNTKLMRKDHLKNTKVVRNYTFSLVGLISSLDEAAKELENSRQNYLRILKKNLMFLTQFTSQNKFLMYLVLLFALLQAFVLYFFLLQKTFRISGPLSVLSGHLKEVIAGKKPEVRPLRERDEFKELYLQFQEMVKKIEKNSNYFKKK